eukprot:CAMPEP_0201547818 /NCGR_PEP_ID=MMETSP0173_2-20130828/4325_1 /ASSEMBLY_ACC=CAM_ASM_000268 /TAXON_ID=218659 /ORGANISM="Vexillifera sp., Strain DIVA3 564/2" /LENGTH=330 /DNA_ID=CAMNT_0047956999 /DNA_START=88 /DNA_END=1077 /DNA_ORIENTATION=+
MFFSKLSEYSFISKAKEQLTAYYENAQEMDNKFVQLGLATTESVLSRFSSVKDQYPEMVEKLDSASVAMLNRAESAVSTASHSKQLLVERALDLTEQVVDRILPAFDVEEQKLVDTISSDEMVSNVPTDQEMKPLISEEAKKAHGERARALAKSVQKRLHFHTMKALANIELRLRTLVEGEYVNQLIDTVKGFASLISTRFFEFSSAVQQNTWKAVSSLSQVVSSLSESIEQHTPVFVKEYLDNNKYFQSTKHALTQSYQAISDASVRGELFERLNQALIAIEERTPERFQSSVHVIVEAITSRIPKQTVEKQSNTQTTVEKQSDTQTTV